MNNFQHIADVLLLYYITHNTSDKNLISSQSSWHKCYTKTTTYNWQEKFLVLQLYGKCVAVAQVLLHLKYFPHKPQQSFFEVLVKWLYLLCIMSNIAKFQVCDKLLTSLIDTNNTNNMHTLYVNILCLSPFRLIEFRIYDGSGFSQNWILCMPQRYDES